MSTRAKWILGLLAALLVTAAGLSAWRPFGAPLGEASARPRPSASPAELATASSLQDSRGLALAEASVAPGESTEGQPRTVRGRVVCSATGIPLLAMVRVGERGVWSDPAGGQFEVRLQDSPLSIEISATGYRSSAPPVPASAASIDLGTVELEPTGQVKVFVTDEFGMPVEGAQILCAGSGVLLRTSGSEPREVARTGPDGMARIPAGEPLRLLARWTSLVSDAKTCAPGATSQLILQPAAQGIRLVLADTGGPAEGVQVQATRMSAWPPLSWTLRSDAGGLVAGAFPRGLYEWTLTDGGWTFAQEPEIETRRALQELGADVPSLRVKPLPLLAIEAVDDATGAIVSPLYGRAQSFEEPPFVNSPRWVDLGKFARSKADSNRLDLHDLPVLLAAAGSLRLAVNSPGYHEGYVLEPATTVAPGRPHVVRLTRAHVLRLRILDPDDKPIRRRVFVREQPSGRLAFEGFLDAQGRSAPIAGTGSGLTLHFADKPWARVVAALTLPDNPPSELVLRVDASARIAVDLPDSFSGVLACAGEDEVRLQGERIGAQWTFDELCAGRYEVGTPESLSSLSVRIAQGLAALDIDLASGETRRLAWDELGLTSSADLVGRVTGSGPPFGELSVLPNWSPLDAPVAGGRALPRVAVNEHGEYRFAAMTCAPTWLQVAQLTAGGEWMTLAAGAPGGTIVLECAPVTLDISGPPGRPVQVRFKPGIRDRKVLDVFYFEGRTGQRLDLGWIPIATDVLYVAVGEDLHELPLALQAGRAAALRLELP